MQGALPSDSSGTRRKRRRSRSSQGLIQRSARKGYSRKVELPLYGVLGSSLSSGAARRLLRIRQEAPEDCIADAPLEAPQRFLAGLALICLLVVVSPAPSIRPGLAYRHYVQGVVEVSVACHREKACGAPPPRSMSQAAPCLRRRRSSSAPWWGNAPRRLPRPDDLRSQDGTYAEDLGEGGARGLHLGFDTPVQVGDLPVSSVLTSRNPSEASRRLRRAEAPLGRMERRMRAARSAESVLATPPG